MLNESNVWPWGQSLDCIWTLIIVTVHVHCCHVTIVVMWPLWPCPEFTLHVLVEQVACISSCLQMPVKVLLFSAPHSDFLIESSYISLPSGVHWWIVCQEWCVLVWRLWSMFWDVQWYFLTLRFWVSSVEDGRHSSKKCSGCTHEDWISSSSSTGEQSQGWTTARNKHGSLLIHKVVKTLAPRLCFTWPYLYQGRYL